MKAAIYEGGQLRVCERPEPVPGPGEARIRTSLAGICQTDLEILQGYAAFSGVPGHEFVGIVDISRDEALLGRRVVGEINVACGECEMCGIGRGEHCDRREVLGIRGRDGTLAQYVCLPTRNLHLVPDSVPDTCAVFTEPLAAACRILEQLHIGPRSRVAVLGDGKLGLLVAQVLALSGAELTVLGHHPEKLAILSRRGIAIRVGVPHDLPRADVVVECTGQPSAFETARRLVRPGGTIVLKSTHCERVQADFSGLAVDEVTLVGSRCGPFATALRLLEMRLVDVASLIAASYPLNCALEAFEHAARPGALKVQVDTAG